MSDAIPALANLIGGEPRAPASARYLDVHEPATGRVFARCPDSEAADVDAAVAAARRAAPDWAAAPPERRARLLNRLADLVERELDALAALESRDSGKPSGSRAAWTSRARWRTCASSPPPSPSGPANRTRPTPAR